MLTRAGHAPLVVERQRETGDALCGGFLSWRSLRTLAALGFDAQGHRITRLRILANGRAGEAALPGAAIGISRRRLDGGLLQHAENIGVSIERGVTVRHAEPGRVELDDGAAIACETLFLATGKHDARGLARPRAGPDPALGLRLRMPATSALHRLIGDAIELHLFRGGYAGLLLQEDGGANLCLAVRKSRLAEAGDPWTLLESLGCECPALGDRLAFADRAVAIDAVGSVPYGWRATRGIQGLYRLGDQAAVIPSLAGEGMGIALASGAMAADAWLAGGPAGAVRFQAALARRTARPVRVAGWLRDITETAAGRAAAPHLAGLARPLARLTRMTPATP